MRYYTTDRNGITEIDPPPTRMREILCPVDGYSDPSAADVWLTHVESGWTLSVFPDGFLELDKGDDEGTLCLPSANMATAFEYWRLLAHGQLEALLKQPWKAEGDS